MNQTIDDVSNNISVNENEYIDILTMAYLDGVISSSEREILDRKAKNLGLTRERADELEEQIKKQSSSSVKIDDQSKNTNAEKALVDNRSKNREMGKVFVDVLNAKYESYIKQLSRDNMFTLYQSRDRSSVNLVFRMDQEPPIWFGFVVSFGNDINLEFENKSEGEKIDYIALDVYCNNDKSRNKIKEWLDNNCKDVFPSMYVTGNKLILLTKKEFKSGTSFDERKKALEEMTIQNLDILFPMLVKSFGRAV